MIAGLLQISDAFENIPVLYPISILLHLFPWQKPKTPKSTPPNEARGIDLTMGVDITDIKRRTNAANSKIVNGVAGRSILFEVSLVSKRS